MDGGLRSTQERTAEGSSGRDVFKLPLPCAILLSKISHVERTVGEKEKIFFCIFCVVSLAIHSK